MANDPSSNNDSKAPQGAPQESGEQHSEGPKVKADAPGAPSTPPQTPSTPAQTPPASPPASVAKPEQPVAPATPPGPKPAAPAAPTAAKPAPPPKDTGPKPTPLDNELTQRLKAKFGEAIREATLDRKQAIVLVAAEKWREICFYCRDQEKFDYLADLTAVDWPKREKRFDLVANLYSFSKNERLRLKAHLADGESAQSVVEVWPVANWLEREAYDMFGIPFEGHPNLKRILLPEEWQGYPLRKDYDILKQDEAWVRENLGIESGQ